MKRTISLIIILFNVFLISGCSKEQDSTLQTNTSNNTTDNTNNTETNNEHIHELVDGTETDNQNVHESVDGYKSFKFGMKPSELIELKECNKMKDNFESYLVDLSDRLSGVYTNFDTRDYTRTSSEELRITKHILSNNPDKVYQLMLENNFRGVTEQCEISFFGNTVNPEFKFNENGTLSKIIIRLGKYDLEKFKLIYEELNNKYGTNIGPRKEQITSFDIGELKKISWFYAFGSVVIFIDRHSHPSGSDFIRVMGLEYNDSNEAISSLEKSKLGVINSNDL